MPVSQMALLVLPIFPRAAQGSHMSGRDGQGQGGGTVLLNAWAGADPGPLADGGERHERQSLSVTSHVLLASPTCSLSPQVTAEQFLVQPVSFSAPELTDSLVTWHVSVSAARVATSKAADQLY